MDEADSEGDGDMVQAADEAHEGQHVGSDLVQEGSGQLSSSSSSLLSISSFVLFF